VIFVKICAIYEVTLPFSSQSNGKY